MSVDFGLVGFRFGLAGFRLVAIAAPVTAFYNSQSFQSPFLFASNSLFKSFNNFLPNLLSGVRR